MKNDQIDDILKNSSKLEILNKVLKSDINFFKNNFNQSLECDDDAFLEFQKI